MPIFSARYDAIDLFAFATGSLISPTIYQSFGYYGSYSAFAICLAFSLCYLITFVSEAHKPTSRQPSQFCTKANLIDPLSEVAKTLAKKRKGQLRLLLWLQILAYFILWFNYTIDSTSMEYLYMSRAFESFTGSEYSYYVALKQSLLGLFGLVVLPLLPVHESLYCVFALGLQSIAYFVLPWMSEKWMFYGAQSFMIAYYGSWASSRTLFTFCVNKEDEIGKIFACVGIVAALTPLVSNPVYRKLFNQVLHTV